MKYLYDDQPLPSGFKFPPQYLQLMGESDLPDLQPWWFLAENKQLAVFWLKTLREQYPSRSLIPFAKRDDWSDTLACFDGTDSTGQPNVFHVHAFTEPGWEHRGDWGSFDGWLAQARLDSAEFKADSE